MTEDNFPVLIEVCADSVASAVSAERGGAARIELCSGLIDGGVTPSAGLIETTRAAVSLPLHVMIRPRGGDFCYDDSEFEAMRRDITLAKESSVNGIVFGILDVNGHVDVTRTRQLLDLARPLSVTFHRAFDMTADLLRSLEDLCALGVDRVLTSGAEPTALEGGQTIARLVQQSRGRIAVMAGSGIKPENARRIVDETGVPEIHVGLRTSLPSPMRFHNVNISMGPVTNREYLRFAVVEDNVRKLRASLVSQ